MPFGFRHSQQDADHLHGQLRGHVDQEVERLPGFDRVQQASASGPADRPRPARIIRGVSPELTSRRIWECRGSSIMLSTWPGDGQVLQQRAAEGPRAAGHRRVGLRIAQHRKGFGVGGHRPEALAVRGVLGRFVPVHRGFAAVHGEQVVRETVQRSCPDR